MATTTVDMSTGSIGTDKTSVRRYVKLGADKEGKTIIEEQRILAETAAKDKKTGLAQNWQKAEDDGLVLFSENTVTQYSAKTEEGFSTLVPDAEQRLYIINAGLSTVQTAKTQAFMKANKENAAEPTPEFQQVDLDLRVGIGEDAEYSIQIAPQRRSLTDQEKLEKLLKSLNLSPEQQQALLMSAAAATPAV